MGKSLGSTGLLKGWAAIVLAIAVMGLYGWLMDFPNSRAGAETLPPEPAEENEVVSESGEPSPTPAPPEQPVAAQENDSNVPLEEGPGQPEGTEEQRVAELQEEDPLTTPVTGQPVGSSFETEPLSTFQTSMEPITEPEAEGPGDQITFPMPNGNRCALFQAGEIVDWGPPEQGNGIVIRARGVGEVRAAASGKIVKLHRGPIRGLTLFQITQDGRFRLEYGHLGPLVEGLKEGNDITCGQVFSNLVPAPGSDIVQIHFAVFKIEPGQDWWAASEAQDPEAFLNLQPDEL